MAGSDAANGPVEGTLPLWERCNEALLTAGTAGREAGRLLAAAARADERLHTYNRAPLLSRPGFLDQPLAAGLGEDLSVLVDVLVSLPERLFDSDWAAMCARVGIEGPMRDAVLATAGDDEVLLARADVVMAASGAKAIEMNIHSSLGGMDIGPLAETFRRLPVYRQFIDTEHLVHHDPLDTIVDEVLAAAVRRGLPAAPAVALVDWPTTYPVYADVLRRVCELLRARGVDAFAAHAGQLRERGGRLLADGRRVDVLYRIFMLEDLPQQPDLLEPVISAYRAGNLLLAMGFDAELVGNKASLALVSQSRADDVLTPRERATVDRILPQTRIFGDPDATWDGRPCDLAELAAARRPDLVLKPAVGHGTLGVVVGRAVDDDTWRQALASGVKGTAVLQERVEIIPERVPQLTAEGWRIDDFDVNWGVFVHGGQYAGAMLRALPSERPGVISLGSGGAVGCCYHREPGTTGSTHG